MRFARAREGQRCEERKTEEDEANACEALAVALNGMLHELEFAFTFLSAIFDHVGDTLFILAGFAIALLVGETIFARVRPNDFREVPIVRRCASMAGTAFALAALLAALLASRGLPVNVLAPLGEQNPNFSLFAEVFMAALRWLDPQSMINGPRIPQFLYGLGVLLSLAALALAVFFWRHTGQFKAFVTALLTIIFTAVAIMYAAVALIWLLQLLNIWFIAVAGVLFQKYRNLQLGHGHGA